MPDRLFSLPLSQIHLPVLMPPAIDGEHQRYLAFVNRSASGNFVSKLVRSISPVKSYRLKRKSGLVPVEYVTELRFLQSIDSDMKIDFIVVGTVSDMKKAEIAICQSSFVRNLSPYNNKDLYGLEKIWKSVCGYKPEMKQEDYVSMLSCERSILYRHHKVLMGNSQQKETRDIRHDSDSYWGSATSHIPPNHLSSALAES